MANEVMAKAITGIDDRLIIDAHSAKSKKRNFRPLYSIGAVAVCLVLIFTAVFALSPKGTQVYMYSDKITSTPCAVTSPLSLASSSQRSLNMALTLPLELKLSAQTTITCSQGAIDIYHKGTDSLIHSGDSYTAQEDVNLVWIIEEPHTDKVYTLTLTGKDTLILNLEFDETQNNWMIFIEK
ncbi:MAG: hypothetical protein IJ298_00620 [Ruminococcus sp.]|nr:hypothetical protein [Ruminococcus sp.]